MRLIDADVAHEMVKRYEKTDEMWACTGGTAIRLIHNAIDRVPTVDAVPAVRCRECIFYDPENSSNWCSHPKGLCNPGESDFCSYGQEREKPVNSTPLNQEER